MFKVYRSDPDCSAELHQWHDSATDNSNHLFNRDVDEFASLAEDRRIWIVELNDEPVAMLYVSENDHDFEVGGLFVLPHFRSINVAEVLFVFAFSDLMVSERPYLDGKDIIFYAHKHNLGPATVAERKFHFRRANDVKFKHELCKGMEETKPGVVEGSCFGMHPTMTLSAINEWWSVWDGSLSNGARVEFETLGGLSLEQMKAILLDIQETI